MENSIQDVILLVFMGVELNLSDQGKSKDRGCLRKGCGPNR
jgi:hypothetical protein